MDWIVSPQLWWSPKSQYDCIWRQGHKGVIKIRKSPKGEALIIFMFLEEEALESSLVLFQTVALAQAVGHMSAQQGGTCHPRERPHQTPTLLPSWSWTSCFQNCEEPKLYCSIQVHGVYYGSPSRQHLPRAWARNTGLILSSRSYPSGSEIIF